jgi:anti-sigma regulatory factor (Ser/Thr protein kinase)
MATHLELGALDSAVPCARKHARNVVIEWGLASLADATELVVAELTTNAIGASQAEDLAAISLRLASDRRRVLVLVRDGSKRAPVRRPADPEAERGRGLLLVDSISLDWGSFREPDGKVVWAVLGPADPG